MDGFKQQETKPKNRVAKKRWAIAVISLIMALVLFTSLLPMFANALSINGEGNGIKDANGNSLKGYAIQYADNTLGFRFTLVDTVGDTVTNTLPYDVYDAGAVSSYITADKVVARFEYKYSKKELIDLYENINFNLPTTRGPEELLQDEYSVRDSDWGISLPDTAAKMPSWCNNATNTSNVLYKAWGYTESDLSQNGWAVVVEPIYALKVDEISMVMTVTEIAVLSVADGSAYDSVTDKTKLWDAVPNSKDDGGASWAFISGYTHGEWPNSLMLSKTQLGIAKPSKSLSKDYRGTSRQIIEKGYGMMIVYSENLGDYLVEYDGNGATGGSTASSRHTIGVAKKLTKNGFVRDGYEFVGWNAEENGEGTAYADEESVTNLATTSGETVTLYAQWEPITYTVKYDGNGADGGTTASSTHTYDEMSRLTWNGFTKTGYTFVGWTSFPNGPVVLYKNGAFVKNLTATDGDTITLYAKWEPITYTVQYDGNGADSGSTADSTHTYNDAKKLTENGYTKTGYTFVGWTDGSGTAYEDKAFVKNLTSKDGDTITLYAKWKPITYTVQYDGNGADGGSTADSTHTYDEAKNLTANGYTKTGYSFEGWTRNKDDSVFDYEDKESVKNLTVKDGDTIILYAQWRPDEIIDMSTYTVQYDGNGADGGSTASSRHTIGLARNLTPNGYTKVGYVFTGWTTNANGSGTFYSDEQRVVDLTTTKGDTVTLYAQWKPITYMVQYDGNGADGGSTASSKHIYDVEKNLTENGYTKTGHTFVGWTMKKNGLETMYVDKESVKNLTVKDGDAITLYAEWRSNEIIDMPTYTVRYDGNGADGGSTASSTHTIGVAKNLTANGYTKAGYVFTGWNTRLNGFGTSYSDEESVLNLTTPGNTVVLYAQWVEISQPGNLTYTVQYDGNGATGGATASSTHTIGVAKNLTANGYTRAGYVFTGWTANADGSGTSYFDKQSVLNLTTTSGSTVTLYARWEAEDGAGPMISAVDRWFTLDEARAGMITREELMSKATVMDDGNGPYTYQDVLEGAATGACTVSYFDIPSYCDADFINFPSAGSTTVTYRAVDTAGNVAYKTVTVYIVDNDKIPSYEGQEVARQEVRFISYEFYRNNSGAFIDSHDGGLDAGSKWVENSGNATLLTRTLVNDRASGSWDTAPVYSFSFERDDIKSMKHFVETYGPGNSLGAFYGAFMS